MVARFSFQKDHECLLEAMKNVPRHVQCVLAGTGPLLARLRTKVRREGLADRVFLPGESDNVAELLARCQVFVLASRWEGLPISVLEAMRAGLPVVASDVGGVSEAVTDGETGWLVPPGNPGALAARIRQLAMDPRLRVRMGEAGRKRQAEHFTACQMTDGVAKVYRDLLLGDGWREGFT